MGSGTKAVAVGKTTSLLNGHTFAVLVLLAVHLFLGMRTIVALSPTYDEPVHLAAGYSFLTAGDYRMDTFAHAPLAQLWASLPLLVIQPSLPVQHPYWNEIGRYPYPFADIFLYKNRIDAARILNTGRMMILLLSLALGIAIYFFARELSGKTAALFAVFLWSFAPFSLANGTLVTTDMALALFFFTSVYFFRHWWKNIEAGKGLVPASTVLLGMSVGCALASKHSAVALFPVTGCIMLHYIIGEKAGVRKPVFELAGIAVTVYFVLFTIYGFNPLTEYYWPGL